DRAPRREPPGRRSVSFPRGRPPVVSRLSLAMLVLALAGCGDATERAPGGAEAAARPPAVAAPAPVPATQTAEAPAADPAFESALAPVHDVEIRARAGGEVMT